MLIIKPPRIAETIITYEDRFFKIENGMSDEGNILQPYRYPHYKKLWDKLGITYTPLQFQRVNVRADIKLRPYQQEAIEAFLRAGTDDIRTVVLPTGAGKTVVALKLIEMLGLSTLVVTPTLDLVDQWKNQIYRVLGYEAGVFTSRKHDIKPITITTYQSALKMKRLDFGFNIFDEVHHLPTDARKEIHKRSYAIYRLGLTATVENAEFIEVVYHKTLSELQEWLANFEVKYVLIPLTEAERKHHELYSKKENDLLLKYPDLPRFNRFYSARRKIESLNYNKAKFIVTFNYAGRKTIIFTKFVEHSEKIAKWLNAPTLHGKMPSRERKKVLNDFREKQEGILIVTPAGDEGIDIPDADTAILVSYDYTSDRQFIQRIGRVLRPKNRPAEIYVLVSRATKEELVMRFYPGTMVDWSPPVN